MQNVKSMRVWVGPICKHKQLRRWYFKYIYNEDVHQSLVFASYQMIHLLMYHMPANIIEISWNAEVFPITILTVQAVFCVLSNAHVWESTTFAPTIPRNNVWHSVVDMMGIFTSCSSVARLPPPPAVIIQSEVANHIHGDKEHYGEIVFPLEQKNRKT